MASDEINNVIELLKVLRGEDVVTVKFRKKDNSIRVMKCTLNFDKVPVKDRPKDVNLGRIQNEVMNKGLIHVYDLEKNNWRTINFNSAEWVQTSDNKMMKIVR